MEKPKADYLFEISWEVCNKVGGIYTVIESKAATMYVLYGDKYFLIGPYFKDEALVRFSEEKCPPEIERIFAKLKNEGARCHYGKWRIDDVEINTILVDFSNLLVKIRDIKKQLFQNKRFVNKELDSYIVWGYIVGRFLEEAKNILDGKLVAHFHEYLCGASIIYLKRKNVSIPVVFTTHATYLGRIIASSGLELYNLIKKIKPEREACRYKIEDRYILERESALSSTVFTTVSEITDLEARYILGRKADLILPNGLNIARFPSLEVRAINHAQSKKKLLEFVKIFFFPYYKFDTNNSLLYFISGRYEFRNKGIDVFIKALGKLNNMLKKERDGKTIIVFLWIPAKVNGININLLQNKINYDSIKAFVFDSLSELRDKIIESILNQKLPTIRKLFGSDFQYEMKKRMIKFKRRGKPIMATHDVVDGNDKILKALRKEGLNNSTHDKVKVIYYPVYLSGTDGLINMGYYQAAIGCQLGVFPSIYEPWGYTPLETTALGVPSITTDLSGFGLYIQKRFKRHRGLYILKRNGVADSEAVNSLAEYLFEYSRLSREERIKRKLEAKRIADLADWRFLVSNYVRAHNLALALLK